LYECLYECAFGYLGIPTTISREKLQLCECLIYVFMNTCVIGAHVTRALGYRRVFRYLRTHTRFSPHYHMEFEVSVVGECSW